MCRSCRRSAAKNPSADLVSVVIGIGTAHDRLCRSSDLAIQKRSPAMKTLFGITVLAVLLVAPSPCFALWVTVPVSKAGAKELGMEVRTTEAGPNHVRVELELNTEGKLKRFSPEGNFSSYCGVELRIGEGKDPLVTAPLREDRSKPKPG